MHLHNSSLQHQQMQEAQQTSQQKQHQATGGNSISSRTPRDSTSGGIYPLESQTFPQGYAGATGSGKQQFAHQDLAAAVAVTDFKNVHGFQGTQGSLNAGVMGQGHHGMLGSGQNTNSQPNLQQYNMINTIQHQQIIYNQIAIQQPQDVQSTHEQYNQNLNQRKGTQLQQPLNLDQRRDSVLYDRQQQPLSDRCYQQSSNNRDLFQQHQQQQYMQIINQQKYQHQVSQMKAAMYEQQQQQIRQQAANNLQNYGISHRIGLSGSSQAAPAYHQHQPSNKNDQKTRNEFDECNPEIIKQHKSQGQQQQSFDQREQQASQSVNQQHNQDIAQRPYTTKNQHGSSDKDFQIESQYLNYQKTKRADSSGPAPGINSLSQGANAMAGLQSSGGSTGPHSYKTVSGANMTRSRTHGRIAGLSNQNKSNILSMIKCPCYIEPIVQQSSTLSRPHRGRKQPILHSSENTANCGHCGQFYAVKDNQLTHTSASGKKQITNQAKIVKTIRERGAIFKLDEPVSELFSRMRTVSNKVLAQLDPHPHYMMKRIKRIDNLSYIADTLQSDNQTIHHAVHLMDIYSSKLPKDKEYDTVLISLVCLLISTKYLQIKYPGADALNYQVGNRYNSNLIISTEGKVLDVLDWQLMIFPIYDYVKLFISQGCLFKDEQILRSASMILENDAYLDKPTPELAEHFKKYAEFFADFCLYQQCFMTVDPYLLACGIVAYTRKYMGVAIIWRQELELLTKCSFNDFKDLYMTIAKKYKENFPEHANAQNYPNQKLVEENHLTVPNQSQVRKNVSNQLQLSSGGKTKQSQNSSNKQVSSNNNANINHIFGELKTPDKYVFDFNSAISDNKNTTQNKGGFSHDKFQINSSSVEKFKAQKKGTNGSSINGQKIVEIVTNQGKPQQMVFSDNKRQSINAHSFKKMIQKNQINNTLSDEKRQSTTNENQLVQNNYLPYQKRAQALKQNVKMQQQIEAANYSSQKSQGNNNTQMSQVASVTSPSANIGEAENEQEVPPFKPMIIKSNSQAINGAYECNTTTKKSPKGENLDKINALKESINSVNITAKLPSSTTNQSASGLNLKNSNSFHKSTGYQKDIFSNRKSASGYCNLGFGVGQGPIKISQKINMGNSSNKKNKGGNSTAQKSKKSQNTRGTSSSKKMKISRSELPQMQGNNTLRQNLNLTLKDQLEDNEKIVSKARNSSQLLGQAQQRENVMDLHKQSTQRDASCTSHNQVKSNPTSKQFSYISGQPKANMGNYVYTQHQKAAAIAKNGYNENQTEIKNAAADTSSNAESLGGRSILSLKNQVQVIKRKGSYQNQPIDLRININKTNPAPNQQAIPIMQHVRGKNVPNGLLRRATGGNQGTQKSIGNLSCYRSMGNGHGGTANQSHNGNFDVISIEEAQKLFGVDNLSSGGKYGLQKNKSIEDFSVFQGQQNIPEGFFFEKKPNNTQVNPPAIIQKNRGNVANNAMTKDQHLQQPSKNNATKETLLKMTQERGIAPNSQQLQILNSRPHSSQRISKGTNNQQINHHFNRNSEQFNPDNQIHVDAEDVLRNHKDLPEFISDMQNQRYSLNEINNSTGDNLNAFQSQDPNKPSQKMIKSGSGVLGKPRTRIDISRKEMLKKLNEKNDQISDLVEQAHATRPTSNERSSTKKPNPSEIVSNLSISKDLYRQQLFTQKYQGNNQRFNIPAQFSVSQFEANIAGHNGNGQGNSRSEERPATSTQKSNVAKTITANMEEMKEKKRAAANNIQRNQQQSKLATVSGKTQRADDNAEQHQSSLMLQEKVDQRRGSGITGINAGDINLFFNEEDREDIENKNVMNMQNFSKNTNTNTYNDLIIKQSQHGVFASKQHQSRTIPQQQNQTIPHLRAHLQQQQVVHHQQIPYTKSHNTGHMIIGPQGATGGLNTHGRSSHLSTSGMISPKTATYHNQNSQLQQMNRSSTNSSQVASQAGSRLRMHSGLSSQQQAQSSGRHLQNMSQLEAANHCQSVAYHEAMHQQIIENQMKNKDRGEFAQAQVQHQQIKQNHAMYRQQQKMLRNQQQQQFDM